MDKLRSTIHEASRAVHLDPHVKDGFRRTLEALTETPAVAAAPASFRLPRALAWSLAAFVVASTGATATYASTRALPGDALYAMKIAVVEPAESALAFSADAKAEVAVAHLERRFQEAAALSAQGTLDEHDESLAELAARDVAAVDRDDQPVARARFEALAAAYGPSLSLSNKTKSRFAVAVRIESEDEVPVPDYVAKATAEEQIAIAKQKGDAAKKGKVSAAVSLRLKTAGRLSEAAEDQLEKGSYQSALKLSGAAAQAALEAQLFSQVSSSTTSTAATSTATTTASSTTGGSGNGGGSSNAGGGAGGGVGSVLRGLLH